MYIKILNEYYFFIFNGQIQWCKQVFNDPYSIVMHLLDECFTEFNKKIILALDVVVEKEITCLDILIYLKEVNKTILLDFFLNLTSFLQDTDRFFQTVQSNLETNFKSTFILNSFNEK
jgi:hypothetical protein